eukprot:scaffold8196_cov100-Cylindrotheca_fusiformis.AAC.3
MTTTTHVLNGHEKGMMALLKHAIGQERDNGSGGLEELRTPLVMSPACATHYVGIGVDPDLNYRVSNPQSPTCLLISAVG